VERLGSGVAASCARRAAVWMPLACTAPLLSFVGFSWEHPGEAASGPPSQGEAIGEDLPKEQR
jgi:hypothetical protein